MVPIFQTEDSFVLNVGLFLNLLFGLNRTDIFIESTSRPIQSTIRNVSVFMVSVLLSASVRRFRVSRMRDLKKNTIWRLHMYARLLGKRRNAY